MKDNLEDFIRKNRQEFDDKEPPKNVWKNIAASLELSATGFWNSMPVWRAAAIIFMLLSGYLLMPKPDLSENNSEVAANDFRDIEAFYFQEISEKKELIDEFQKPDGLNGFTQDFKQLEAMYMVLKEEMKSSPSEKVKDAMVLNLLVRINLLNQQLSKLDKQHGDRQQADEEV
jgi:hypothetical protein